jgi:hypothetical protein
MVFECLQETRESSFANIGAFQELDKTRTYACIMQHRDNHIVYSHSANRLILVSIHSITHVRDLDASYSTVVNLSRCEYPDVWNEAVRVFGRSEAASGSSEDNVTVITLERLKMIVEMSDIHIDVLVTHDDLANPKVSYYPPMWILKNARTNQKIEIQNPYYKKAKDLRNMQPNLRYHWLELMKTQQITTYLNAFEMYRSLFDYFQMEYDDFVANVHNTYIEYYVKKNRSVVNHDLRREDGAGEVITPYPKRYFVPAAALHHNVYIPCLTAGSRQIITLQFVKDYFESLPTGKLYYYITNV